MIKLDFSNRIALINAVQAENNAVYSYKNLLFKLNKDVLVPHIDTIALIEHVSLFLRNNRHIKKVADIGTGTGFIALNLAMEFPNIHFYATDICAKALALASSNAELNNLTNVTFIHNTSGVWLEELSNLDVNLIVSNPPFVGCYEYLNEEFRNTYPEIVLEPHAAICTIDNTGEEPFISMLTNALDMTITSLMFQGNADNMLALVTKLNTLFDGKYSFKVQNVSNLPRILIATK